MANYRVTTKKVEGHLTYHLLDPSRKMDFGLVPDIGNFGYEFKVNGKDVLIPAPSLRTYLKAHRTFCGNPFLAPWANRIDRDHYYFQGKKYLLNEELGNLRRDQFKQVIHGLLCFESRWEVVKKGASPAGGAFLTSRLEFYKYPDLAAQFPFAQTYEVTHRLKDGKLEVTTKVTNVGRSPLPLMMAYHPYFRPDGPREEWTLSLDARTHWLLNPQLVATGETEPTEKFLPNARSFALGKTFLDDEFSGLERDLRRLGRISIKGRTQKVEVVYDAGFDVAVIYAPLDKELICIEPQTGPTNCFNLHHEGKYPDLTVLDPGKVFKASFWIIPTGY
jgi:aldose 1-epimerase